MGKMNELREFLRDSVRKSADFSKTDQNLGAAMPPVQKPVPGGEVPVLLPEWRGVVSPEGTLDELIGGRASQRRFGNAPLGAEELSFLLWATQGVRQASAGHVFRTVPSAGNRHSTETYLALTRAARSQAGDVVFDAGLWRYLPLEHALLFLDCPEGLPEKLKEAALGQGFVGRAPAVFIWACIPYRTEWRYAEASHKVIAVDAGHVCQNLYLAAGSIGCGTCAVAAYDQQAMDGLLHLDGEDEFVLYLAPVGKRRAD